LHVKRQKKKLKRIVSKLKKRPEDVQSKNV
jgi:hypothetical protein